VRVYAGQSRESYFDRVTLGRFRCGTLPEAPIKITVLVGAIASRDDSFSGPKRKGIPLGPNYRRDIDGLRAVAVVSVVFCHSDLGLSGGYVGVDVFFVISGYLITSLILSDLEQGTFSLTGFWERRIRRILPALFAVAIATLVAGWLLLLPDAYSSLGQSAIAVATLRSNMLFARQTGYFDTLAQEKPLLHTWSLAVEEQFYLLIPVILLVFARRQWLRRGFLVLGAASILSFGLSVYGAQYFPSTYYLLPHRAWELLVGALLAGLPLSWQTALPRARNLAGVVGLFAIALPCCLYGKETTFPGIAALPPVLGTALLIWSGNGAAPLPKTGRLLALRPIAFVGLISYSLYLWHWPLFAFAHYWAVKPLGNAERLLLVAISVVLAILCWRYIERPFRNRALLASRRQLLAGGALALVCLASCGAIERYGVLAARRWPSRAQLFVDTACQDARYNHNLEAKDVPGNLVQLGTGARPAEILVWGDSHAMAILPAIESVCVESGLCARAATHAATPPTPGFLFQRIWGVSAREIDRYSSAVMRYAQSGAVSAVILVGYWEHYGRTDAAKFGDAIFKTIDLLQAAGVSVYFMKDVPAFGFDVPRALVRCSAADQDLSQLGMMPADYRVENRFEASILPKLAKRGVHILDPVPVLRARTNSQAIFPFDSGGSFYHDRHHLSTYGAMAIKSLFIPVFRQIARSADQNKVASRAGSYKG
jgi:peptidoglycan/LPS O-acetylase OafA/YrhL